MKVHIANMTENQLWEREEQLERLMREGALTPEAADELSEVRLALKRIQLVKSGKTLWA